MGSGRGFFLHTSVEIISPANPVRFLQNRRGIFCCPFVLVVGPKLPAAGASFEVRNRHLLLTDVQVGIVPPFVVSPHVNESDGFVFCVSHNQQVDERHNYVSFDDDCASCFKETGVEVEFDVFVRQEDSGHVLAFAVFFNGSSIAQNVLACADDGVVFRHFERVGVNLSGKSVIPLFEVGDAVVLDAGFFVLVELHCVPGGFQVRLKACSLKRTASDQLLTAQHTCDVDVFNSASIPEFEEFVISERERLLPVINGNSVGDLNLFGLDDIHSCHKAIRRCFDAQVVFIRSDD